MRTIHPAPSDQQLIAAIRTGGQAREDAWQYITTAWGAYCRGTAIKLTGCTREEAETAFSDAVVSLDKFIRRTAEHDFLKIASLKTYLTRVILKKAWSILKRRRLGDKESDLVEDSQGFRKVECRKTMENALAGIGERCKNILLLFNDGYRMKEIAEMMGFENEDVARKEKYKCQAKFRAFLLANPDIKALLLENCYG